jgi:magnesium transporter
MFLLSDIASLALAPQSLLAPLSAVTLVLNALAAPCFLKETLTYYDKVATVFIFLGAGVSTQFGQHDEKSFDVHGFVDLYGRVDFILFETASLAGVVFLWLFIRRVIPEKKRIEQEWREMHSEEVARDGNDAHIPNSDKHVPQRVRMLPFAVGCLAGLAGAQQTIFTKSVSELLSLSIKGDNQFIYPLTYIMLAAGIFFAIFQISYVSVGLEHFDAVFYLPIYNAFFIVLGILSGSMYFNEIKESTLTKVMLFSLGVALTVFGVLVLTKRDPREKHQHTADDSPSKPKELSARRLLDTNAYGFDDDDDDMRPSHGIYVIGDFDDHDRDHDHDHDDIDMVELGTLAHSLSGGGTASPVHDSSA